MATTKIWDINVRLDHVIDYITDLEKTKNLDYGDEFSIFHNNESLDIKTEKECFVSAINCSVDIAYEEMMITKKTYNKTGGILGFHAYQSFGENEVTPEIAHQIGVQLASEMWGSRFEVVVSTHQNTKHIHNHFVINSVSFKDGKKYYDNHINYARMRRLSDDLCAEYGLSVISEKETKGGLFYNNFYNNYIEHSDYYEKIREDIDFAILKSYSYNNFLTVLESMGYKVIIKNNILSLTKEPYKLRVRISRTFGKRYNKRNIIKRIEGGYVKENSNNFFAVFFKNKNYKNSIYKLFKSYCDLLENYSKNKHKQYFYSSIRKDIKELDYFIEQTTFLSKNNVSTDKDLNNLKLSIESQLDKLLDKLDKINYKKSKLSNESYLKEIEGNRCELVNKIKKVRYNLRLINEIEKRKPTIENKINSLEKEYRKEVDKDELRRGG